MIEIELLCANAQFFGIAETKRMLKRYKRLKEDFPNDVLIKDVSMLHQGYIYKEASIFTTKSKIPLWKKRLKKRGIKIDIIH